MAPHEKPVHTSWIWTIGESWVTISRDMRTAAALAAMLVWLGLASLAPSVVECQASGNKRKYAPAYCARFKLNCASEEKKKHVCCMFPPRPTGAEEGGPEEGSAADRPAAAAQGVRPFRPIRLPARTTAATNGGSSDDGDAQQEKNSSNNRLYRQETRLRNKYIQLWWNFIWTYLPPPPPIVVIPGHRCSFN